MAAAIKSGLPFPAYIAGYYITSLPSSDKRSSNKTSVSKCANNKSWAISLRRYATNKTYILNCGSLAITKQLRKSNVMFDVHVLLRKLTT